MSYELWTTLGKSGLIPIESTFKSFNGTVSQILGTCFFKFRIQDHPLYNLFYNTKGGKPCFRQVLDKANKLSTGLGAPMLHTEGKLCNHSRSLLSANNKKHHVGSLQKR